MCMLANKIVNGELKGIHTKDHERLAYQLFADDARLFLQNT